jgi:hypothetical protein
MKKAHFSPRNWEDVGRGAPGTDLVPERNPALSLGRNQTGKRLTINRASFVPREKCVCGYRYRRNEVKPWNFYIYKNVTNYRKKITPMELKYRVRLF